MVRNDMMLPTAPRQTMVGIRIIFKSLKDMFARSQCLLGVSMFIIVSTSISVNSMNLNIQVKYFDSSCHHDAINPSHKYKNHVKDTRNSPMFSI